MNDINWVIMQKSIMTIHNDKSIMTIHNDKSIMTIHNDKSIMTTTLYVFILMQKQKVANIS